MRKNTKSPLKGKPLRNPGQTLDEKIQDLMDNRVLPYAIITGFSISLTGVEWWRWHTNLPYAPITWTYITIAVLLFTTYKLVKLKREIKNLKLGRDGERVVGQYLENLRSDGCRILHDIVGDNFNIDHVVICEHGVFSIETKTYSKPASGDPQITVKGERIIIPGKRDNKIPDQAKAEARWLHDLLLDSTGRVVMVKPVVLFPGWYINSSAAGKKIWVLSPKALPSFIANEPKTLSKEDVMLLTYHISRYIRTT